MAKRVGIGLLLALGLSVTLVAQAPRGPNVTAEEFEAKLGYQTGVVALLGGLATIDLPANFRFIGPQGARRLLTEGWGNPPEAAREVLGMLVPTGVSPLAPEGWAGRVENPTHGGNGGDGGHGRAWLLGKTACRDLPKTFRDFSVSSVFLRVLRE